MAWALVLALVPTLRHTGTTAPPAGVPFIASELTSAASTVLLVAELLLPSTPLLELSAPLLLMKLLAPMLARLEEDTEKATVFILVLAAAAAVAVVDAALLLPLLAVLACRVCALERCSGGPLLIEEEVVKGAELGRSPECATLLTSSSLLSFLAAWGEATLLSSLPALVPALAPAGAVTTEVWLVWLVRLIILRLETPPV